MPVFEYFCNVLFGKQISGRQNCSTVSWAGYGGKLTEGTGERGLLPTSNGDLGGTVYQDVSFFQMSFLTCANEFLWGHRYANESLTH